MNRLSWVAVVGLGLVGCTTTKTPPDGGSGTPESDAGPVVHPVFNVEVFPNQLTLAAGGGAYLQAELFDTNGELSRQSPTWTVDNPAIVTVDSMGKVTAVGTGTATVTATSGTRSGSCSISVEPPYLVIQITGSGGIRVNRPDVYVESHGGVQQFKIPEQLGATFTMLATVPDGGSIVGWTKGCVAAGADNCTLETPLRGDTEYDISFSP